MILNLQDFSLTYSETGGSEIFYQQKRFTIRTGVFENYTCKEHIFVSEKWDLPIKLEIQLSKDTEHAQLCTDNETIEIVLSKYFKIIESLIKTNCPLVKRITKHIFARYAGPVEPVGDTICLAYGIDQEISVKFLMGLKPMQPIIVTISNKMQGQNWGFTEYTSVNHLLILSIEEAPISQT